MLGDSIVAATYSTFIASKGSDEAVKVTSTVFSISLFPIIGLTAVSEL
jgi:hypothetical protein